MRPEFLSHDLIGRRVRSAGGEYLGVVSDVELDCFRVVRRLLGVGPTLTDKRISADKIDDIQDDYVTLKPSDGEYWQRPDLDDLEEVPRYFVL